MPFQSSDFPAMIAAGNSSGKVTTRALWNASIMEDQDYVAPPKSKGGTEMRE